MPDPDVSDLLTVAQAIALIDGTEVAPRVVAINLSDAQGLWLAEAICADRDYPPFDKSLMDGYAIRSDDQRAGRTTFRRLGEVAAGEWPTARVGPGQAVQVMTGAPMPSGADGVVPVENVVENVVAGGTSGDDARVELTFVDRPSRFVAGRGSDVRAGQVVLQAGTRLEAAQLAVAASVGAGVVRVHARPRVAVLGTGDELVPFTGEPGPAQIRNSNNVMLVALLRRLGCDVTDLGTAPDEPAAVRAAIDGGLAYDCLFITGGMSMGAYDYVPRTLIDLGATLHVTKLRIKPGKPFVFATVARPSDADGDRSTACVFGLPGNPVSAFVCTTRLAARLLARLVGASPEPAWREGRLTGPLPSNGPREFYQPAVFDGATVRPLAWKGSADVYTLAVANALLVRPENDPTRAAGDVVRLLEIPS